VSSLSTELVMAMASTVDLVHHRVYIQLLQVIADVDI